MKVKQVVRLSAETLGREDLVAAIDDLEGEPEGELASLLRCYNLIENEIALDYFPLRCRETLPSSAGKIAFSAFSYAPVSVASAQAEGRELQFGCTQQALCLFSPVEEGQNVTVEYCYSPAEKEWEDDTAFSERISARLMAFGIACEYCLSRGKFAEAAMWESKYRDALKAANAVRKKLAMRSRRWV